MISIPFDSQRYAVKFKVGFGDPTDEATISREKLEKARDILQAELDRMVIIEFNRQWFLSRGKIP